MISIERGLNFLFKMVFVHDENFKPITRHCFLDGFFWSWVFIKQFTIKIYPSKLKCWDVGRDIARFLHSKAGHVWIAKNLKSLKCGQVVFKLNIHSEKMGGMRGMGACATRHWDISPFHAIITHRGRWIYSWVNSPRSREIPGSYIHVHSRLVASQFASKRCTKSKDACQSTDWMCIYIPEI